MSITLLTVLGLGDLHAYDHVEYDKDEFADNIELHVSSYRLQGPSDLRMQSRRH